MDPEPKEDQGVLQSEQQALLEAMAASLDRIAAAVTEERTERVPYLPPLRSHAPRRFRLVTFLEAVPAFAAQFRLVPEEYVAVEGRSATVQCPCGGSPTIEFEDGEECACERFFLASNGKVFVMGGPHAAETPPDSVD